MRLFFCLIVLCSCLHVSSNTFVQEIATAPARTPEQEAAIQTQKMQAELNLNDNQAQEIYEINLKHARERQVSNSRSQALERVKNKDHEIQRVLTPDQYNRLQDKRYERYPSGSTQINRTTPQQRTQTAPQRTTNTDQRSTEQRSTRTVVPQRTTPDNQNRNETTPRTASPGERININQNSRSIPVNPSVRNTTPQERRTPTQEQNRTTRTPTATPSNNEQTQRR